MAGLPVMSVDEENPDAAEIGEGSTRDVQTAAPLGVSEAATLAFGGICYRIVTSNGEKRDILRGISGYCKGGRLLALMGASGELKAPSEGAKQYKRQCEERLSTQSRFDAVLRTLQYAHRHNASVRLIFGSIESVELPPLAAVRIMAYWQEVFWAPPGAQHGHTCSQQIEITS